mmetsp:Transcript_80985/g.217268  ORF Transcript_80985/g.217268 Transcript_80985/m.217268 type:complete len:322 (-) Transcript_80985:914-1879(-)
MKADSSVYDWSSSVSHMPWFLLMRSLSRDISACSCSMPLRTSFTSFSCTRTCPSMRTRFCASTAACDSISASLSACEAVSLASFTSSVCVLIHIRCRSPHARFFWSTSLRRFLIVASSGPTDAAASPAAASSRDLSVSNLRFRLSRSLIFFSISSFRRRISTWYLAMSASLRRSSSSTSLTVALSCSLCAMVLSESTLMRASSFLTCAMSFSLTCMLACIPCVDLSMLCAAFWRVVWLARELRICSSIFWVSAMVAAKALSTLSVSSVTAFCSCIILLRSESACSNDFFSNVYCSFMRFFSLLMVSICFSRNVMPFLILVS